MFACRKYLFNDGKSSVGIYTFLNACGQNKFNYIFAIFFFVYVSTPPIPDDTTEFLHGRADTKYNVTCEDGLE